MSAHVRSAVAGAAAALAVFTLGGLAGAASAAGPSDADRVFAARTWMVHHQSADGGLPGAQLSVDQPRTETWGALGLAAASINAADQREAGSPNSLYDLLGRQYARLVSHTGDIAYLVLAAHAVGADPEHVGPDAINLIGALLAARVPDGSAGVPNPDAGGYADQGQTQGTTTADAQSTALASIAFSAFAQEPRGTSFYDDAVTAASWLVRHQSVDGSWPAGVAPDTETTALAIEAIVAAGLPLAPGSPASRAISLAQGWLQSRENADGGFGTGAPGAPSDTLATASAVRALIAARVDPHRYLSGANQTPLSFLASVQNGGGRDANGSFGRAAGVPGDNPTLTTAYAMVAFAGLSLPLAPVTGSAGGDLPPQGAPVGLPTGPTLPVEVSPPAEATVPTAPAPSTPTAPTIQPPTVAPTAAAPIVGVRRIEDQHKTKARKKTSDNDNNGDRGTGTAGTGLGSGGGGSGSGAGGGGAPGGSSDGGATASSRLATPGAPSQTAAPATAVNAPGAPVPLDGQRGGTPTKITNKTPREVSGTLIGHDSTTPGAKDTSTTAGASTGGHRTPWWAIALALLLTTAIATGLTLDRHRPDFGL